MTEPWPNLLRAGTVTINPDGKILVEGFEVEHASCREAVNLALAWAMEQVGIAMRDQLSAEYPSRCAID